MTEAVIEFPRQELRDRAGRAEVSAGISGQPGEAFAALKAAWQRDGALTVERRRTALAGLTAALLKHETALVEAISADFGHRSPHETRLADLFPVLAGLKHARRHLRRWMRPRRQPIDMLFQPGRGRIQYQALGVIGIISPWNYPVQLTLGPLTAAVAAGNRVLIKPSEFTPRTGELMARLLAEVFEPDEVAVVLGGADLSQAVSRLKLDHLIFTGSTPVGRHVMRAAAENLVPVTLELGGKSPAIVASDYSLTKAAATIAAGKLFNAGQTCIAPDYVLVPQGQEQAFAAAFAQAVVKLYPHLADNPDYTAIVNDRHYQRLSGLVAEARKRGADVVEINPAGESLDASRRKMTPTLLLRVPDDALVMKEEIFGPLLPIVSYRTLDGAWAYINERPRPLALYLFSHDSGTIDRTLERTISGGVTVNDTLLHVVQEELPFGGVGDSGMGAYHGEQGFRTLSHAKSVFLQSRLNGSFLTRPPFGRAVDRLIRFILK
jgi:coniferyl-aldehyde dehydrogenase